MVMTKEESEAFAKRMKDKAEAARRWEIKEDIFAVPAWMPAIEWKRWVRMRKRLRLSVEDDILDVAVARLDALWDEGHHPQDVLLQSTRNLLFGLYAIGDYRKPEPEPGPVVGKSGAIRGFLQEYSTYRDYLLSDEWKKFRLRCLEYYGNHCYGCKRTDNLQAHHRHYDRVGTEDISDITIYCQECHRKMHGRDWDRG